jgi:hypothetical protein
MPIILPKFIALSGFAVLLQGIRPLMHSPFLGMFEVSEHVIGLVALIGSLGFTAVLFVTVLYFQSKKRQMWHETARLALEKGQPLPPWPNTDEELKLRPPPGTSLAEWEAIRRAREQRGSLKAGLILIAVGVGLYIMMQPQGILVGAIPGLIGVALIVHALIERLFAGGRPPGTPTS